MPTPKNKYDREHLQLLKRIERQIDEIYKAAIARAAVIGAGIDGFDPSRPFRFEDYPLAQMQFDQLLKEFEAAQEVCIVNGVDSEWTLANNKNNELANRVFGDYVGKLTPAQYRRYYSTNDAARESFLKRKFDGLNLSDRVWKYTGMFKEEIEMGLDLGIRGGLSADKMAADLRQYLQHPDMLFRRVRDEHGILHLSQRAAAFHPGRGVYRSSYMNARRLAATEANIAYDLSDYERRQQLDFVVGIEVHLSNNHTCKGRDGKPHPFYDICDDLQGKYPKDFKFVPWHPHCRCYTTSILKSDKEIAEDLRKIEAGEPLDSKSVNAVTDVPDNFKEWLADNEERLSRAQNLPYFLQYNGVRDSSGKYFLNFIGSDVTASTVSYEELRQRTLARAAERHANRTPDEIRRIQDLADERRYGKAYVDNVHQIETELGMKRGKRMTHDEANKGNVNPNYPKAGYMTNCSTCSGIYILRRMGFNVEAKPNKSVYPLVQSLSRGMTTWEKWVGGRTTYNSTLYWMRKEGVSSMNKSAYRRFLDEFTKEPGIYEFNVGYGTGGGHSTLLERRADGTLVRIEQQTMALGHTLDNLLGLLEDYPSGVRGVMKVDDALFDSKYAGIARKVKSKKP